VVEVEGGAQACQKRVVEVEAAPAIDGLVLARELCGVCGRKVVQQTGLRGLGGRYEGVQGDGRVGQVRGSWGTLRSAIGSGFRSEREDTKWLTSLCEFAADLEDEPGRRESQRIVGLPSEWLLCTSQGP
jgi:hypothetical protein